MKWESEKRKIPFCELPVLVTGEDCMFYLFLFGVSLLLLGSHTVTHLSLAEMVHFLFIWGRHDMLVQVLL